jgi:hypothetical protein
LAPISLLRIIDLMLNREFFELSALGSSALAT